LSQLPDLVAEQVVVRPRLPAMETALLLSIDAYRTRKTRVEEVLRADVVSDEMASDADDVLPSRP